MSSEHLSSNWRLNKQRYGLEGTKITQPNGEVELKVYTLFRALTLHFDPNFTQISDRRELNGYTQEESTLEPELATNQ